ncbi:hypothetical protein [Atlantibacter subterraneus]|uniref:hypothetical protein n=1 Tax=Atlantibacter subterraneus TaxID=255519 RepID=UPI002FDE29E1
MLHSPQFSKDDVEILTYAITAKGYIGFNLDQQAKLQRAAKTFIDALHEDIDTIANNLTDDDE